MRESVADLLRAALHQGKFRPGESLSEPALASQLGVSRGPVREALLVLAQEGLVTHNQNRGFSVLKLTPEDGRAMSAVRLPLETLALELASERVDQRRLRALEKLAKKLVDNFDTDRSLSARADLEFHEQIWELSGNPWLVTALRRIAVPFFTFTMMFREASEDLNPQVLDEQHRSYIEYLRGDRSRTAEDCVRQHLRLYRTA